MPFCEKRGATWSVMLDLPPGPEGKRRRTRITAPTKKEAEAEYRRQKAALDGGTFVDPTRLTLTAYLDSYLAGRALVKRWRPKVAEEYEKLVRCHLVPTLGHVRLQELAPWHLEAYQTEKLTKGRTDGTGGLAAQTVRNQLVFLSTALEHAVRTRLILSNPARMIEMPSVSMADIRVLTPAEVLPFLARVQEVDQSGTVDILLYAPALLAIGTALRLGEVLGLQWRDVDLDGFTITVRQALSERAGQVVPVPPKTTKSAGTLALPPLVVQGLVCHKGQQAALKLAHGPAYDPAGWVVAHPDGTPYRPQTISKAWENRKERLGYPDLTFHGLRHSHASILAAAQVHPKVISERLRHTRIGITMDRYTHTVPAQDLAAAAAFEAAVRSEAERRTG